MGAFSLGSFVYSLNYELRTIMAITQDITGYDNPCFIKPLVPAVKFYGQKTSSVLVHNLIAIG